MCRYLNVSPSAYYQWRNRKKTKREQENDLILKEIRKIHAEKLKETYGVIRLQRELSDLGYEVTQYRVRKIMKTIQFINRQRKKKFRYPKDSKTKFILYFNISLYCILN